MAVFVVTAVVFYRKVVANVRLSETGVESVEILSALPHKTYFTVFLDIRFEIMISLNMNFVKLKILEKTATLRKSYCTLLVKCHIGAWLCMVLEKDGDQLNRPYEK